MTEVYPWSEGNARAHVTAKLEELRLQSGDDPQLRQSAATLREAATNGSPAGKGELLPEDSEERDQVPPVIPWVKELPADGSVTEPPESKWNAKLFDPKRVGVTNTATEKVVGATALAVFRSRLEHLEHCWQAAWGQSYREARIVPPEQVDRRLEERDDLSKAECVKLEQQVLQDILDAIRTSTQPRRLSQTLWPSTATLTASEACTPHKGGGGDESVADKNRDEETKFDQLMARHDEKRAAEREEAARVYAKSASLPDPSVPYFRRKDTHTEVKPKRFLRSISGFSF